MAINQRGFTLLVAVIFMSVMLALGLALASLAYKQEELASSALESQNAFYAADAGLECALRADQQESAFDYTNYANLGTSKNFSVTCAGTNYTVTSECYNGVPVNGYRGACPAVNEWIMAWKVKLAYPNPLSQTNPKACAVITIYKPDPTIAGAMTYIFSQGYDTPVPCTGGNLAGLRFASRGLYASYSD